MVNEIRSITPNIGQKRLAGTLRSRGLRIPRSRVRTCLREIDSLGTALRWRATIYRRKYFVLTPNSLWHIDGNQTNKISIGCPRMCGWVLKINNLRPLRK